MLAGTNSVKGLAGGVAPDEQNRLMADAESTMAITAVPCDRDRHGRTLAARNYVVEAGRRCARLDAGAAAVGRGP